jgi:hypothetical protein
MRVPREFLRLLLFCLFGGLDLLTSLDNAWGGRVVEFIFADQQVFQDDALLDSLFQNAWDIRWLDVAVENPLWVDRDDGAELALFQTASAVGSNKRAQFAGFDFVFEGFAKLVGALRVATATGVITGSLIATNEDMMRKGGHWFVLIEFASC